MRFVHKKSTRKRERKGSKGGLEDQKKETQRRKGAKTQRKTKTKTKTKTENRKQNKKRTKTKQHKTKCLSIDFPFQPFPFSLTPFLFSNPFSLFLFLLFPLRLCVFASLRSLLPAFPFFI
ncbi:MAG: hypothetical protein DWH99_12095 [Planctomycetota bacterium]|nr:MAG: hypothetical protein DWH99_12095 [Planctomycetota bacterium]